MTAAPDFLPEWNAVPNGRGKFIPIYRRFDGEDWKQLWRDGRAVLLETADEARKVARDHVKRLLNPEIKAQVTPAVETPIPAILDVDQWRLDREDKQRQERDRTFGAMVFPRRGKPVRVEKIRRRA